MALINCPECSNQVSDKAPLCMRCGYPLPNFSNLFGKMVSVAEAEPIKTRGALTKAQCTNCNAMLEVDASTKSAMCPFCNTSYIVEQAINNYNINIASNNMNISNATINMAGDGHTVENYLKRANEAFDKEEIFRAEEYYNEVLDMDAENVLALDGLKRIKEYKKSETVLCEGKLSADDGGWSGQLILLYDRLKFKAADGRAIYFEFKDIKRLDITWGALSIIEQKIVTNIKIPNVKEFIPIIDQAKRKYLNVITKK